MKLKTKFTKLYRTVRSYYDEQRKIVFEHFRPLVGAKQFTEAQSAASYSSVKYKHFYGYRHKCTDEEFSQKSRFNTFYKLLYRGCVDRNRERTDVDCTIPPAKLDQNLVAGVKDLVENDSELNDKLVETRARATVSLRKKRIKILDSMLHGGNGGSTYIAIWLWARGLERLHLVYQNRNIDGKAMDQQEMQNTTDAIVNLYEEFMKAVANGVSARRLVIFQL